LKLCNKIPPAVNQIEVQSFCQQRESAPYLRDNHILAQAWGPLSSKRNHLFENGRLNQLAAKPGGSLAQILARWPIQRGMVAIPKSVPKERIV
jgi:diketogulonate reductase-like aldo/keto reductase